MLNYQTNMYEAILQELRGALDGAMLTQADVGNALGIKQSAVSTLLSGRSRMTLEQYIAVANLLGQSPQKLLATAEVRLTKEEPMPYEIESVIYSSELHLLAYCAACVPIRADEFLVYGASKEKMKGILEELVQAKVLKKDKGYYVQANPHVSYVATGRSRPSMAHQKIVAKAWELWEKHRERESFRLRRFNFYLVDRFTNAQMKELEAMNWRAYEKVCAFQRENMSRRYDSEEPMNLWSLHIMQTTPLQDR